MNNPVAATMPMFTLVRRIIERSKDLLFNLFELFFGSWLLWHSAIGLGYIEGDAPTRAILSLLVGLAPFVHGGVSVTQKLLAWDRF
jgi:hypothetical protein